MDSSVDWLADPDSHRGPGICTFLEPWQWLGLAPYDNRGFVGLIRRWLGSVEPVPLFHRGLVGKCANSSPPISIGGKSKCPFGSSASHPRNLSEQCCIEG